MAPRLLVVAHAATTATWSLVFGDPGEQLHAEIRRLSGRVMSWVSGPEAPCQATAVRLGSHAKPIPDLRDCDFGAWRGRTLADVAMEDAGALVAWLNNPYATPHGGESLAQLIKRVGWVLDDHRWPEGRSVVVVTPLVARAAAVHALGAPPEVIFRIDIAPLGRVLISRSDHIWRVQALMGTPKDRLN